MGKLKYISAFALGALFFVACGHADIKFPYKFFHASPTKVWEIPGGQLIGQGVKHELTDCRPYRNNEGDMVQRCVVVFYDELNKVIKDYKNTKQELIDCQRGR